MLDSDVLAWRYEAGGDERFFHDLGEVREIIEPSITRLAALHATSGDRKQIVELCEELNNAAHEPNNERYLEIDQAFHMAILRASHNELLIQLGDVIQIALRISRQLTASVVDNTVSAMPLHWEIARGIDAQDHVGAELAMRALLRKTATDIAQRLGTVSSDRESIMAKGESLDFSRSSDN
ncbi:MAG: FadR/GntR family transcriptional regulator [Thermomicrobiales bacterium]